jgi:hypothetical protein
LHLSEGDATSAPPEEGATLADPIGDLDAKALASRIEHLLGTDPSPEDVDIIVYSLFNTFRQLSGGPPLEPPNSWRSPFPFGLENAVAVIVREVRAVMPAPPAVAEFVAMAGRLPASFHDLLADADSDPLSDSSSMEETPTMSVPPIRECAVTNRLNQPPLVEESQLSHTPHDHVHPCTTCTPIWVRYDGAMIILPVIQHLSVSSGNDNQLKIGEKSSKPIGKEI